MLHDQITVDFFFTEKTVTEVYLEMMEQFVIPQLRHLHPTIIFQQDGVPRHWSSGKHMSGKH